MKSEFSTKALIYLRAAELVEQNGICKKSYGYDGKQRCARGHILDASRELFGDATVIHQYEDAGGFAIMAFNDAPDTTAAMVAAKLREQAFA